jgi:hypothetical protein
MRSSSALHACEKQVKQFACEQPRPKSKEVDGSVCQQTKMSILNLQKCRNAETAWQNAVIDLFFDFQPSKLEHEVLCLGEARMYLMTSSTGSRTANASFLCSSVGSPHKPSSSAVSPQGPKSFDAHHGKEAFPLLFT